MSNILAKKVTLKLPAQIDQKYIQEALAAMLYNNGEISSKEACDMTGTKRREFEDGILQKFGFAVLRDTEENFQIES